MRLKLHSSLCTVAFFVASLCVSALLIVACSPDFGGFGFGGSGGAGSSSGVGTPTGPAPVREPTEPCDLAQEGATCSPSTPEICEMGDAANARCNVVLRCENTWERAPSRDCSLACPPAFTLDASADLCTGDHAGALLCEYPQGTCGCAPEREVPDAGDAGARDAEPTSDAGHDGGDAGDAGPTRYLWKCVGLPAQGCPKTRPRLGSACVKPMTCDYGACVFEDGIQVECLRRSHWVESSPRCGDR